MFHYGLDVNLLFTMVNQNGYNDEEFTAVMLFELLFGDNFERIREETERYGRRKDANYSLSIAEVKCCIAVLLVNGYSSLPRRYMHWEEKDDVKNEMISKNIRRKTFDNFMSCIHVADSENLPPDSKVARVQTQRLLGSRNT